MNRTFKRFLLVSEVLLFGTGLFVVGFAAAPFIHGLIRRGGQADYALTEAAPTGEPVTSGSGDALPEGTFSFKYDGDLSAEFVLGRLFGATASHTGGAEDLALSFVSYRTKDGGATKTAVPFTLEYSVDGGTTWSATPPSWLVPDERIDYGGSADGEPIRFTVSPQANGALHADSHHAALVARGSRVTAFDLSTLNVATGGTVSRTTANCYVVDRPGKYKFPLVYGNGVVDGAVNESAFRGKAGVSAAAYRPDDGETDYLGRFKDHLDNNIMSPYIAKQHSGKAMEAVLVWEDEPGLVAVDPAVSGTGEDACITFSVPAETIAQGNALIALKVDDDNDGEPETIAWSWHVWVTEEDLTDVKEAPNGYLFAPVNVGWCGQSTHEYAARSCEVRAVQSVSRGVSEPVTVAQAAGFSVCHGNSPYYQWGRKDPLQASRGYGEVPKDYYPSSPEFAPSYGDGKVSIGTAIRNPHVDYDHGRENLNWLGVDTQIQDWCNATYYNSWSSAVDGPGEGQGANAETKTVYDPSPVGYRVPALDAFKGLSRSGCSWQERDGVNGQACGRDLFFPAMGLRNKNFKTLILVGSVGSYWSSVPDGEGVGCDLGLNSEGLHVSFERCPPQNLFERLFPEYYGGTIRSAAISVRPVRE